MGNKESCEISPKVDHSDPNNNAKQEVKNDRKKEAKKDSTPPAKAKKGNNKRLVDDIPMKVGKLVEEEVITKLEDKVIHELQNTPRYRQLISRPLWRESIQSLKSEDVIYKVSARFSK